MKRDVTVLPKVAIFLAGVAAGAITGLRKERTESNFAGADELKRTVAELERRLAVQESTAAARFQQMESRIAELPSTVQIVAAMEQLLKKTMSSLDERLSTQAHSIEVLKTAVSQTDGLLERVLESLDSLQTFAEPSEEAEEPLLQRPAV